MVLLSTNPVASKLRFPLALRQSETPGTALFCSVLLSGDTIPKRSVSGHVPSETVPGFQTSALNAPCGWIPRLRRSE
jgi:hypothetical protein